MSNPFETPLRFKLNALRVYQGWLLILHIAAGLLLLFFTSFSLLQKVLFISTLLVISLMQWQRLRYLPQFLIQKDEVDWVLEDQAGKRTNVSLMAEAYVTAWLIIICFKDVEGKVFRFAVLPYMMEADCFRKLSVYLRMTKLNQLTDE